MGDGEKINSDLKTITRRVVEAAVRRFGIERAWRRLGISRSTLYRWRRRWQEDDARRTER